MAKGWRQNLRWGRRGGIITGVVLAATLMLSSCGGGAGGDQSPTFHFVAILASPLPADPIATAVAQVGLGLIDCYPGSSVRLYGADTVFLKGSPTPSTTDATTKMQWSSSDPSVATVSAGLVTCLSKGTTQISGTLPGAVCDGAGTPCLPVQLPVTVGSAKHTLTLSPSPVSLKSGQSQQMTVSLITETAPGVSTTQDVTAGVFSGPGSPIVALIVGGISLPPIDFMHSQNGNLVAQGSGSAVIFVSYPSGGVYDYLSNLVLFTSK